MAAAVDALVPRRWLLRALSRRGRLGQSLTGGLLAVPCMMCTCCTAPVTVAMRRSGVQHLGLLAVLVAAVIGTPLVIPTAGEIPLLLGLATLGPGSGVPAAVGPHGGVSSPRITGHTRPAT